MIEKKTDKGNLENKRTLFLLLGFVVVLGLVYAGFELFASEDKAPGFTISDDDFIEVKDEDVIATDQTPPPPPEPQQQQHTQSEGHSSPHPNGNFYLLTITYLL